MIAYELLAMTLVYHNVELVIRDGFVLNDGLFGVMLSDVDDRSK